MAKVLLVNTNMHAIPYPVPPVGLCLVAESLAARGHEARVYDGVVAGGAGLAMAISEFRPGYVGVGIRNIDDAVTGDGPSFVEPILLDFVKPLRAATRAPLILGGAGFSVLPDHLMSRYDADYGILGEAEESFPSLIEALDKGHETHGIAGVVHRGQKATDVAAALEPVRAETLPFSRIDAKLDYAPYRLRAAYPIQTKRGCAKNCLYCTYPSIEGTTYRLRPASAVADEIGEAAGRLGSVVFEFVDSVFNDPPGHAEAICAEIVKRKLKVRLRTMGVNPAGVTDSLLSLMTQAGFAEIDCTPDSAAPTVIERLGKNFTRATLESAARLLRGHAIPTIWFFVFGGPSETEETIAETFDFVDRFVFEEDLVYMTQGLRIYPKTGLQRVAIQEGIIDAGDPLVEPRFYVSPRLGRDRLAAVIERYASTRLNCLPASEASPPKDMMQKALEIRNNAKTAEPMFRTLLRLRRQGMGR